MRLYVALPVALLAAITTVAFREHFDWFGAAPDFLLLLGVFIGLSGNREETFWGGVCLVAAAAVFGENDLTIVFVLFELAAFFANYTKRIFVGHAMFKLLLVAVVVFAFNLAYCILLVPGDTLDGGAFAKIVRIALYTAAAGWPGLGLLEGIKNTFGFSRDPDFSRYWWSKG